MSNLLADLRRTWNDSTEVCGLVLRNESLYAIRNVHAVPKHQFEFSVEDLKTFLHYHSTNDVIGIYHTHPSNSIWPSDTDIDGWPSGEHLRYWVITKHQVAEWRRSHDGGVELVNATSGSTLDLGIHRPPAWLR